MMLNLYVGVCGCVVLFFFFLVFVSFSFLFSFVFLNHQKTPKQTNNEQTDIGLDID